MLYFVFLVWFSYYFGCLFYVHKKQFQPYFNRMQNVVAAPPAGHSKVQKQHWPNIYIYIYIYKRYRLYCLYVFYMLYLSLDSLYVIFVNLCYKVIYLFFLKKKKSYIFIVLKVVVCFFTRKLTVMVFLKATIIIISSNWCLQY